MAIKPTDNILLATKTDEDVSTLDVYVYDEATENMHIHHEVILGAFPLCSAWLDFDTKNEQIGNTGKFCCNWNILTSN